MKNTLIDRPNYINQIKNFIDKDFVKIVIGVRRCGKSDLLKLLQKEIKDKIDEQHIIEMNFEKSDFFHVRNYIDLTMYIEAKMIDEKKYYLFLDEPQEVEGWEKAINALRFKNTDIYITGSNSKLLSSEFATLLGGRILTFRMYPLSFIEFVDFRKAIGFDTTNISFELDAYIKNGGFPSVSLHNYSDNDIRRIVTDIHSTALLKDVINRNGIRNTQLLEKIVAFIYDNLGNLVSLTSIVNYLKSQGRKGTDIETISGYLTYLEQGHLIARAQRYDIKGKKLLETNDKYYLSDHSQQYAVRDFRGDKIQGVLENIVYCELVRRGYRVYVGKFDTREIDFVAEKLSGEKIYVQVTLELSSEEVIKREFTPLKEIKDSYSKYVVSMDRYAARNDEGVIGIHLKDFLISEKF